MKASSLLHCALRSPDPVRIGKFYAGLFDCGFFIHPVLAGLGVVIVKIASPESVFRGLLEFWPLDLLWDGATASLRRIPKSLPQMQNHVALRVDWSKEQILEELNGKGIAATSPAAPALTSSGSMIRTAILWRFFPALKRRTFLPKHFPRAANWNA
jgi:hypothetical protein